MYKHAYTLYSAVRPFGCAVALGSFDEIDGPQLFMVDPSGVSFVGFSSFSLRSKGVHCCIISRATLDVLWEKQDKLLKLKWRN